MQHLERLVFSLFAVVLFGCATAQETDPAKAAFSQKYPDAEDVSWNTDGNGYREAKFELNGEKHRADFQTDGTWIETERNLDWDDLPDAVKDAFKDDFDKDDIVEIELVDHHAKGWFYDIEFKKKGKKTDVEINPGGVILKIE